MEIAADSLDGSVIFHAINEISGFVLYMHQQIPAMLQDITLEFDSLCSEYKDLEMAVQQNEVKPSLRRKHAGEMREARRGIRRFEKLMRQVSDLQTALKQMISGVHEFREAILIVGGSPLRPQHVYELSFSSGTAVSELDFAKSRASEVLCRKAIRGLIAKGAGCAAYSGPSKLFLLVKAPASFNLPLHFLPKRDFRYSNKIVPLKLKIKSKTQDPKTDASSQTGSSDGVVESTPNDFIWYAGLRKGGFEHPQMSNICQSLRAISLSVPVTHITLCSHVMCAIGTTEQGIYTPGIGFNAGM